MSDSETKGRCRKQIEESYADNLNCVPRYAWITADAIDRLAADVAAVKDMAQEIALRVPSELGRDACDVAVRVLECERDAAVRERDEARALLGLAQVQRTAAYADRDVARAEVERLKAELDKEKDENRVWVQAVGLCATAVPQPVIDGRGPLGMARQIVAEVARLRAEVERLKRDGTQAPDDLGILQDAHGLSERCKELASRIAMQQIEARAERVKAELNQQPAGNPPKTLDSSTAAPQPAGQGISPKVADTQPAGNAAPAAGWLTEREQHALRHILAADVEPVIRSILARAGSPPVVEVPELGFIGPMTGREQGIVLAYRDALDAAGVKWKEVGRE